jgi:ion channel-forming bestrophin family protein
VSNLVVSFAIALKHKLRFQPYTAYDDINHLVSHLQTFAGEATKKDPSKAVIRKNNFFKETGDWLGLSFTTSNPRKTLKRADAPLGNLPFEILNYVGLYLDKLIAEGKLTVSIQQTIACRFSVFLSKHQARDLGLTRRLTCTS